MQFTAAGIFHALNYLGYPVSLNDVCVFIPAGFSCLACLFTAGIAHEAAGKRHKASAFAVTTVIMAILPAHIMRSVAGRGFHSSTFRLNLSCFCHKNHPTHPPKSAYIELKSGRV